MNLTINLNNKRNGIDKAIKELNKYKKDLIQKKCVDFVNKLADRGIQVAKVNSGIYKDYIIYEKKIESKENNKVVGVFVAKKKSDIFVQWKNGGYDIDPLLMAEFGSGWLAYNVWGLNGVGQGTHPKQKYALNPKGWWWIDNNNVKHHSIGQQPTLPVYNAYTEMENSINEVAKEVFK